MNVNPGAIMTLAWMLLGLLWVWSQDRKEMRKQIPYGNMPSLFSLKQIRIILYATGMMICAPFAIITPPMEIYIMIRRALLVRQLKKLRRDLTPGGRWMYAHMRRFMLQDKRAK